jgi:hypothetical protein
MLFTAAMCVLMRFFGLCQRLKFRSLSQLQISQGQLQSELSFVAILCVIVIEISYSFSVFTFAV